MKQYDVTALGELLIDFTSCGVSGRGNPLMEANPGGAPCNVLAMLARLGRSTAFIGKVGRDSFGDQLQAALKEAGIHTEGLQRDADVPTTLAFVHTGEGGERSFTFYRRPGADMMLHPEETPQGVIAASRVLHFGSLSMTDEPCRSATKTAVAAAEEAGVLRSFDPNLRPALWHSMEDARAQISWALAHCDVLKVADNELAFLSGTENEDGGLAWLRKNTTARLILLTKGAAGSRALMDDKDVAEPAFSVVPVDTTGAGDTFCACALHHVLEKGLGMLNEAGLRRMLRFANAAAALVTTRWGALRSMPSPQEIDSLLRA
ncbi:MAG: carbohydrate kinase [Clostridia bacterium]|nr:carbohydrate kinase [Clostridia bacterium]